jgi:anti-sigma factor RsiW
MLAMVTCKKTVEMIADLVENTLPAEQRDAVAEHLRACRPCETFLQTYRKTSSLCRHSLLKAAPPELVQRLMSYLRENASGG